MPFIEQKTHGLGPNYLTVNVESDDPELAMEWATTFTTDDDVRNLFFEVGSTPPAYDPLPIVEAAPEGTGKTIALIQLSRIEGMSTIPENAEGVVQYPGWWGRYASAFTQRAVNTAMEQILLGEATPQEAMSEAKAAVDAEITEQRERARN
jgi:ABC-type glycerol-3-phosphate transport system substrate-binding protein